MKQSLLVFSVFLAFSAAQAAIVEGHFYAKTCGENVITSQILPIDRSISSAQDVTVTQLCHGDLLVQGAPVETLRINFVQANGETAMLDFAVVDKSPIQFGRGSNRSMIRDMILTANNQDFGTLQFNAKFMGDRLYAIETAQDGTPVTLAIQVLHMQEMLNIATVPAANDSVLRGNEISGNIDLWNPKK